MQIKAGRGKGRGRVGYSSCNQPSKGGRFFFGNIPGKGESPAGARENKGKGGGGKSSGGQNLFPCKKDAGRRLEKTRGPQRTIIVPGLFERETRNTDSATWLLRAATWDGV